MSVETAFETLRRVNPVPDPAAFRAQLEAEGATTTTPRRQTMDTKTRTVETGAPPARRRTRRRLPAIAAATALVLLAVPILLLRGGDPVGEATPSPVEVAEAYIEGRNAFDAAAIIGLFDPSAVSRSDPWITSIDQLEMALELRRIYGEEIRVIECSVAAGQPRQVTCATEVEMALQRIVAGPPIRIEFWFTVSDEGRITHFLEGVWTETVMATVWDPWDRWLESTHPGIADSLFGQTPRLTPEALELTPGLLAEYRAYVEARG